MEFYFTDRSFHLLGIATAGSDHTNDFRISGEIERTNVDAAMVAFTGTLYFPKKQLSKAEAMCQDLNYMLYMDDDGNGRMITITASHADGTGYCIAFEGTDAGNDLKNEIVDAYTATTQMTFEQYFNIFTGNSGWEIGVNEIPTDVRTLTFDSEDTSYDRMNSVATQFGVETYFSFSIVGTTMVKCYLNVVKKRGADRGITLRVGDEINRITVDSDSTNLMTAIYARGATPDGSDTPINLVGYSYTDPTGQFVLTKEGYLLDTVSNRIYSRLRQNSTATVDGSYLNHVIDYEATTQASLLQSALADLKQNNHPAVNYTIELAKIPQNIRCGDTVQIEQEDRQLYLSARVLELDKCYSNPSSSTMVMGDYLLETSQVAKQYQDLAQKLKDIPKTIQYYPWLRYADDDQGTNMSALPAGKKYMAVVYSNKSSVPSDNPADYAGKWALIKGADGADGVPGAKGADGRTSYFHTAWANDVSGQSGFTVSGGDGKKYIGTYSDFTQADSTNPADYNWALFKGEDGDVGPKGDQGLPGAKGADGRTAYTHFAYANSQDGKTDFSTTDSNRKYIGFYSDFTSGDSTNPSDYNWSLIKGADGANGKDGVPGKAGADGKTSYFHIAYADSSDGRTNFSLDTPGSRKYIGSYTDFTQADSNNPAVYSWQLVQGPQGDKGERGKQIFKSSYEDGPNSLFNWWSDLSPAPSVDNPPKIGDTVIAPSGNIFQIDTVNVGGVGGGGTFGVGGVLGNIKGPQGPQGNQGPQGVPGSKDVPYTYIQLGTPTSPKKGDLWWHGTTLNDATALQYYDGSAWIDQSIQQAILNIEKLVAIEIDSSTINSPTINVPFTHASIEGSGTLSTGKLSLNGTSYTIDGTIEDTNGNPNGQNYHTELNPDGLLSYITQTDGTTQMRTSRISMGTLELTDLVSGLGNSAKYITSDFNAHDAVDYYHTDTGLTTADAKNINITYSRHGNLVNVGFDFDVTDSAAWKKLADIRPGYKPFGNIWAQVIGNTDVRGAVAVVYAQSGGWYMFPSLGTTNNYHGTFTFTTQDDYPTDDVVIK
ncbi:phage tail spike protein [Lacticaseibacillus paracasei]|uniref:phage tail spike protein n=1 Tax=Lacticaseibacillus paracasei TaxID=1597 RepID=UPI003CF62DD5